MQKFDVAVLGGGPGGYIAAIRCSQYGLKTALIENRELGGTCLNRGCIPTKALLYSAEVYQEAKEASKFGVSTGEVTYDFAAIAKRRDTIVRRLRSGVAGLENAHGVTVISGKGVLTSANTISVGDETVQAEKIILATGSRPSMPPIPGSDGDKVYTSDDVLKMTSAPDSMVIVGGGVIGIEFATLFATLGKKVTILEMLPDILMNVDGELTSVLKKKLSALGVQIHTGVKVEKIESGDGVSVFYSDGGSVSSVTGECVTVCAGRKPNTLDIGLEQAGVATERGFVTVDDELRTSVSGIYAIGDITGKIQLAHVASAQGMTAAANCAGKHEKMRYDIVPSCIYTSPEIASVGLSESDALKQGKKISIGRFSVPGNGKAMVMGADCGLVKIVTDSETGEIYGASIMAPRATDMISEISAVMKCEGTVGELSSTIHPHPTVSETIMEAAHSAEGLCCHQPPEK